MTAPGQQEMTRGDLELDETRPVRDALRAAFRAPDGVRVRLHRGGRPAWLMEMGWDGTETVSCGDRFYGAPDRDGLTLVAYSTEDFRTGYPVGYVNSPPPEGGGFRPSALVEGAGRCRHFPLSASSPCLVQRALRTATTVRPRGAGVR
jgi:hypothetical protein